MDKRLISERFSKARHTYGREARVQQQVAIHMLRLLLAQTAGRRFRHVVEFGCGTGYYSRLLLHALRPDTLLLNDLCADMLECVADLCRRPDVCFLPGDAEAMDIAPGTDLITSCSTLQWFADPATFFVRCQRALAATGILAFSSFGPENMHEIRRLTGHGLDYLPPADLARLLAKAGFHLLHFEEMKTSLIFAHPLDVLHHLKQTGVTGTGEKMWTRHRLQTFCDDYRSSFCLPDGKVTLTYHPVFVVAGNKE